MTRRSGMFNSSKRLRARNRTHPRLPENGSRLLSLPVELRDIIWKLVVGGNTLHVFSIKNATVKEEHADRKLGVTVCKATMDDDEAAKLIRHCVKPIHVVRYGFHHSIYDSTRGGGNEQFSLSLLQTCLQVHSEANKLPLATNTFSFCDINASRTWIKRLYPDQRCLVQSLVLDGRMPFGQWLRIKDLTNLSKVTIFNETWDYTWLTGERKDAAIEHTRQNMLKKLDVFRFSKKLKSVTICIIVRDWRKQGAEVVRTDPAGFGRWSEVMEAKLLDFASETG